MNRPMIEEHEAERMIDARVQKALSRDRRYRHAENAEEQSKAECLIELEQTAHLLDRYDVDGWSTAAEVREQLEQLYQDYA